LVQSQDDSSSCSPQELPPSSSSRACLLKGCDRHFHPNHHLDRYCSEACIQAAKVWNRKLANKKYRESEKGKQTRANQAKRYRDRIEQEKANPMTELPKNHADDDPREGYHKEKSQKKSCCQRPGCYEQFDPHPRAPHQKYCGPECYKAMRTVLVREKRWKDRLALRKKSKRPEIPEPPDAPILVRPA
jgi:hypothetical protein